MGCLSSIPGLSSHSCDNWQCFPTLLNVAWKAKPWEPLLKCNTSIFLDLKEERSSNLPPTGSLPKCLQLLELSQAKGRSQDPTSGFSQGCRALKHLHHHSLFPWGRKLDSEAEAGQEVQHSDTRWDGSTQAECHSCTQHPAPPH